MGTRPGWNHTTIARLRTLDPVAMKWEIARMMEERERKSADRAADPDRIRKLNRRWRRKNIAKVRAYGRAYAARNPEVRVENKRRFYERNRDVILARQSERDRNLSTPGAIRSAAAGGDLKPRDIPDETLGFFKAAILVSRELKKVSRV